MGMCFGYWRENSKTLRLWNFTFILVLCFISMPRRTSLDAGKWKSIESEKGDNLPSLWELCIERLLASKNCKAFGSLPIEQQKQLALKAMEKKILTRESLELFSVSSLACCVHLDLSGTTLSDSGLYLISALKGLLKLQLHNCRNITNTGLSYLRRMLFVNHYFNINLLLALSTLEQLDISKCKQISDDGLKHLACM